jgi:hypothetical protein
MSARLTKLPLARPLHDSISQKWTRLRVLTLKVDGRPGGNLVVLTKLLDVRCTHDPQRWFVRERGQCH